jgi:3'-phosphoadenosine 5'-phosphosulfate (PAPS) 3'-phosphatase
MTQYILGEENEEEYKSIEITDDLEIDLDFISQDFLNSNENGIEESKESSQISRFGEIDVESMIVWVDPLDGTKEFTLGNTHFVTSLIGISINEVAEIGIIHFPYESKDSSNGLTYFGSTLHGLFKSCVSYESECDNLTLPIPIKLISAEEKEIEQISTLVTSLHHSDPEGDKCIQALIEINLLVFSSCWDRSRKNR